MNIDNKFVDGVIALCREYDRAPDMPTRIALGGKLDDMTAALSDKQTCQLARIVAPRV